MPQTRRKSFIQRNGLIAVWSVAGFMAMGYIGFLATGMASRHDGGTELASQDTSPPVSPVAQQLAALNANVRALANKAETTSRELTKIKEAFAPTAALPDEKTGAEAETSTRPEHLPLIASKTAPDRRLAGTKVSVSVLPLTENDRVAALSTTMPGETYGIDLAQARSVDSLEHHWEKLKRAHPALFSGLTAHYIDRGSKDLPLYSLIVGSFDLMSAAHVRCAQFSRADIECEVTRYRAGPFARFHTAVK